MARSSSEDEEQENDLAEQEEPSVSSTTLSSDDDDDEPAARQKEYGTTLRTEKVFMRNPEAMDKAAVLIVNKQHFTGSKTSNEDVYFRTDITAPAVKGVINIAADAAVATEWKHARRPICKMVKLKAREEEGSGPALDEEIAAAQQQLDVEALRAKHSQAQKDDKLLSKAPRQLSLIIPKGLPPSRNKDAPERAHRKLVQAPEAPAASSLASSSAPRTSPIRSRRAPEPNPSKALLSVRRRRAEQYRRMLGGMPASALGLDDGAGPPGPPSSATASAGPAAAAAVEAGGSEQGGGSEEEQDSDDSEGRRVKQPFRDRSRPFAWLHQSALVGRGGGAAPAPVPLPLHEAGAEGGRGNASRASSTLLKQWPVVLPDPTSAVLQGEAAAEAEAEEAELACQEALEALDDAPVTTRKSFFSPEEARRRKQQRKSRGWGYSFMAPDMGHLAELDIRQLVECLVQSSKDRSAVGRDQAGLSAELLQIFSGFRRLDVDGDGVLSLCDLSLYCERQGAGLAATELQEALWGLDDSMRGGVTFDEVRAHFVARRKSLAAEEARLKGQGQGQGLSAASPLLQSLLQNTATAAAAAAGGRKKKKRFPPLLQLPPTDPAKRPFLGFLLYRLVFFASLQQQSRGTVHLLTALQVMQTLFEHAADFHFVVLFMRDPASVSEQTTVSLAHYVRDMRAQSSDSRGVRPAAPQGKSAAIEFMKRRAGGGNKAS